MPYVKRDAQGSICAVSEMPCKGFEESVEGKNSELEVFFKKIKPNQNELNESDLGFIRVLEDLIDLLIEKNVFCFTDLPEAARTKIQQRQRLREGLANRLDLLDDPEDF